MEMEPNALSSGGSEADSCVSARSLGAVLCAIPGFVERGFRALGQIGTEQPHMRIGKSLV